jgi:Helix-turn-helix domain
MAYELVDAVFDLALPHVPKAVLLSLARHAQHGSTHTWPSQKTIATESGLALRSVRTGLAYLEKHQLAVPIAYPKGGRGRTTVYELALTPSPEEETIEEEETRQGVPGLNGYHKAKPAARATFQTVKAAAGATYAPINVAKSAQNVAKNVVNVARIAQNVAGAATESVLNLSVGIREESGDACAREDISLDLRKSLDAKQERRDLWQRVVRVLNVRRVDRQEWLDPCTLYEATPHNFLLVAVTRAQQVYVDTHWGIAIWRELTMMQDDADCTLALDYGAPQPQKQRSISA